MGRSKTANRAYMSGSEYAKTSGGYKPKTISRLPFYCCALSFTPFENPVATKDGSIFELTNIVPWLFKYKTNPITGLPMEMKDLHKLKFHKSNDGKDFICPITFKVLNENSHMIAIKSKAMEVGNVYSYDAVDKLCFKLKNLNDLLTEEPFKRSDIIVIQNPLDLKGKNINDFDYVKKDIQPIDKNEKIEYIHASKGTTTDRIFKEMESTAASSSSSKFLDEDDDINKTKSFVKKIVDPKATAYSQGQASASLTSTGISVQVNNIAILMTDEEYMFKHFPRNKKGLVQIKTTYGIIDVELYCSETPRTCYNFIQLAKSGFYKDCKFHRLIKNFMIQGGDPTGTGRGGESIWKKDFKDEIKPVFSHSKRGVLAMANKGPNTNSSQFYITLKSCKHLDGKHTIFGQTLFAEGLSGEKVLSKLDSVNTKPDDSPEVDIVLKDILVIMDPFAEYMEEAAKKKQREEDKILKEKTIKRKRFEEEEFLKKRTDSSEIGKYLAVAGGVERVSDKPKEDDMVEKLDLVFQDSHQAEKKKKKSNGKESFGNFANF